MKRTKKNNRKMHPGLEMIKNYSKPLKPCQKKQYYVYVLECENRAYYVGIAFNVEDRFKKHIKGIAAKFTEKYKPIRIIETMETKTSEMGLANVFENYKVCEYKKLYPNYIIGGGSRIMTRDKYK
jgi:predicted GIY-YIG superfamily endonuclease